MTEVIIEYQAFFCLKQTLNIRRHNQGAKKNSQVFNLTAFSIMARLERFERPTARFVAEYSIQLSYRRFKRMAILDSIHTKSSQFSNNGGERGIRTLDGS